MDYELFPNYYKSYKWDGKHKLFGYPPDMFPEFRWIKSLENRFQWVVNNYSHNNSASKYLLQEMIEWGGSQNGILQKFTDRCGEVNLYDCMKDIVDNLDSSERAISSALKLPGLGLTYASKLLRFMRPDIYGALDSRIREALFKKALLPKIYDGNIKSMVSGYLTFLKLLNTIKDELTAKGIIKPECVLSDSKAWRPSEIEMALFRWADTVS